jgi:dTDP-4-amino-4,6-dideoxygalactose transaminase
VQPFLDLGPELDALRDELDAAFARTVRSRWFVLGEEVERFEAEFAAACEAAHAVGVASGTDALELALRALGVGPGDEVVTTAHTFVATALAVSATGAVPVFADVGEDGLLDPASAAEAITHRTRALLPVDLYGRCADLTALRELADRHRIALVEDAAQAHGARHAGRRAGSVSDLACFSFYPTKNLGALGDGGAVVTSDPELAARLRLLRDYGRTGKYEHAIAGRNSRLDELQAALLRVKLPHLDAWNAARRERAGQYRELLADSGIGLPPAGEGDVFHLFVVRSPARDALQEHLREAGIETLIHYPVPAHRQPVYGAARPPRPLPVTERLAGEVLSLPMYPSLSATAVARITDSVLEWTRKSQS